MQEAFCKVELLENRMENMKKQVAFLRASSLMRR